MCFAVFYLLALIFYNMGRVNLFKRTEFFSVTGVPDLRVVRYGFDSRFTSDFSNHLLLNFNRFFSVFDYTHKSTIYKNLCFNLIITYNFRIIRNFNNFTIPFYNKIDFRDSFFLSTQNVYEIPKYGSSGYIEYFNNINFCEANFVPGELNLSV